MNFANSRKQLRRLAGLAVSLSILANGLLFADNRSHAAVTVEKEKEPIATGSNRTKADDSVKKRISEAFGNLPLSFEANTGQADSNIKFLARGSGYGLFLTPQENLLVLRSRTKTDTSKKRARFSEPMTAVSETLRMKLVNANENPRMVGVDKLPGETNYFLGNDPQKWRTNVANYERVRYEQVYRGIDMIYYGNQGQLEYDFIVAPGVDPSVIRITHDGARSRRIAPSGDLVIVMKRGEVIQRKPIVYQEVDGVRREVAGEYVLAGKREIGFRLGDYDKSKTLIIDPVLTYSTYHGGNNSDDAWSIDVDSSGNVYITGDTLSTNFPRANALQFNKVVTSPFDSSDLFVTKLNAAGSQMVYSTYLGGNSNDMGVGIRVDSSGIAYVAAETSSSNFPLQNPRQSYGGGIDTSLFKLSAAGSQLLYSTYHGGTDHDVPLGLDIDPSGNMYVSGYTRSTNYPTANAFDSTGGGTCGFLCEDGFVFKMNAAGNQLVYSTYLGGGNNNVDRVFDVAVDSSGNAYVVGFTSANNFPVLSPIQTWQGLEDGFVSAFSSTGSLLYSTYLGGSAADMASAVAVDSSSNVYVTGSTESTNFPTLNPLQATKGGIADAFITKINSAGSALVYSTYLGGSLGSDDIEGGDDIVVDADGNAYISGSADSTNFPSVNPVQSGLGGSVDAFVAKLNAAGSTLIYSTYIGGSNLDFGRAIAIDASGNAYLCGFTASTDFPTTNARQPNLATGGIIPEDAFVLKLSDIDGVDITGLIADAGSNPIQGVKVTVTGSAKQFTFTDASGNYLIPNLAPGGNYTLTPSKTNFTFVPVSQTFNNLTVDQIANFTGSVNQVVIDGKVKDANGTGVSGVTVTLSGSQTGSVVTGTAGTYSFSNLNAGGNYTVTPSRASDIFVPALKSFTNLNSNQTFDFTLVYGISGHVTDSLGAPASGVTVSLTGGQSSQTQTDIAGNYSFANLPAGVTYSVTPSKPGFILTYTFTPPSQTFANLAANQTANFSFTTATNTSVVAVADAYVQDGTAAATNFGSANPMLLRSSNSTGQKRDIYLKFDLTTVRRNITSVKLRFTAALSAAASVNTSVFPVSNTAWNEQDPNGINWNNKPALGATLATVAVTSTTLTTYELNVTSWVVAEKNAGRNLISLALHNPGNSTEHINVNSRESLTNKPQLVITTSDNSNAAPSVSVTAPGEGAPFTALANITVNASAADTDGTVSKVEFYTGTKNIGSDNTSPYSIVWPSVEAGAYTLRAVATDNSGATTTSAPVNITVSLPNLLPQVSLTAPVGGITFPAGGTIGLAADASDVDGSITKVEFFTGANLIGTDTTSPYTFSWTNVPAGEHSLKAVATDNSGAASQSSVVNISAVWRTGLTPTMDAYVRDGATASTNFGTATELQVQASATTGSNRETHLKFDITSVSAITGAKLRLHGALIDTSGTNVPTAVYPTTPTTWTESGSGSITWNNKPVAGTSIATATITDNVARWYEWDLTAYIQAEKTAGRNTISLAIKSTANSTPHAVFNSKEAATNQPHLQITTTAIRNILFVTGSSTLNTSEGPLKTRMENLGFTVTVKQAGSNQNSAVNTSDAYGKAAVVISSTVTPANVLAKFRNVAVPVLLWEADLLDDQAMTATNDWGTETGQTNIAIIDAAHPLAAGLSSGPVGVFPANNTLTWGRPNANAAKVATVTTADTTKTTIFGYETGAVMPGSGPPGVPAPARRVGFFLHDSNGLNLTSSGNALFDAAIKWLTATIVTPTISTIDPIFGTIGTSVTIAGYNFGDTQGAGAITFNGVSATPTTWTSTSIVAPVPTGANSGPVLVVVGGLSSNGITFIVELPPVDTDGDGLPDAWEIQYFGNLNQGANDNPDGDALNNLQEYLQGRNPTLGTVEDSGGGVNLRIYTPLIPLSP